MPAKAEDILSGFRVNWMNLRDADTGKILWQVSHGGGGGMITSLTGVGILFGYCEFAITVGGGDK